MKTRPAESTVLTMSVPQVYLSILIPIFNAEKYIGRCLDSLLNQNISKSNYEIIILDDGSEDKSQEVVAPYLKKFSNIQYHRSENVGAYTTRNKLLKLAKGTYIYCVDADDYIAHNALGGILQKALDHNLDIAGFETLVTNNTDEVVTSFGDYDPENLLITSGCRFLKDHEDMHFEIWWYLIRRSYLEKEGLCFDSNEFNADVLFTLKAFIGAGSVAYFPISVYRYFQSPHSLMRNEELCHQRVMIDNLMAMILDFNQFITSIRDKSVRYKKQIIHNLERRRDHFVVFLITKMIDSKLDSGVMKNNLERLKTDALYPVARPEGSKDTYAKKAFIRYILNREYLLYPFAGMYKVSRKIMKA